METYKIEDLTAVDEDIITLAAAQFNPGEDNIFSRVLEKSVEFRKAGLKPVFLCTEDYDTILVTSHERINKKCH